MTGDIEKIINDGVLAPSGENCQPWKFKIAGSTIHIFNVPELDQSVYNFLQRGSYVAHGALIENLVISASQYGYNSQITLFPKKDDHDLVAEINLTKISPKKEILYPFIGKRHTNRKEYKPLKLSDDQKKQLLNAATETGLGISKIIDDQEKLNILGKALAVNERIIFENKELHKFFYDHIIWNEEDQDKSGGFYIKTLEFLPHQLKGVKLFKKWPILKILNTIGKVSKMIAKENGEKYARSGALAIVAVNGNTNSDYVNAGRVAERVWLKAAELGISVQPCTGVLYFMENIKGGNASIFSQEHRTAIETAYQNIKEAFGIMDKTVPMLFRLGFADPASARSMRMKPNISTVSNES